MAPTQFDFEFIWLTLYTSNYTAFEKIIEHISENMWLIKTVLEFNVKK